MKLLISNTLLFFPNLDTPSLLLSDSVVRILLVRGWGSFFYGAMRKRHGNRHGGGVEHGCMTRVFRRCPRTDPAAEPRLPPEEGRLAHPVPVAQVRHLQPGFSLLQDRGDLLLAEPCPFHGLFFDSTKLIRITLLKTGHNYRGQDPGYCQSLSFIGEN